MLEKQRHDAPINWDLRHPEPLNPVEDPVLKRRGTFEPLNGLIHLHDKADRPPSTSLATMSFCIWVVPSGIVSTLACLKRCSTGYSVERP